MLLDQPMQTNQDRNPGMPPQARDEDARMQLDSLMQTDHEAMVVVEYVDHAIGIAQARELVSGLPVALADGATAGFASLEVGQRLLARITKRQHATAVEDVQI